MPRTATSISRAIATPSARAFSPVATRVMRAMISSGTETRNSFFMNSALRALTSGQMPATTGMRQCSIRRRKSSIRRRSKTGWVTANSAPACTLYSKRRISSSMLGTPGLAPTPITNWVPLPMGLLPMSSPWLRLCTMLTRPIASTAVFDVDAIGLVNIVHNLNHGLDIGSNPIGNGTKFVIGVGANPGVPNIDEEIRRFEYKVQAGAEYAVTQPVFDLRLLEDFLRRIEHCRIPVVAGIW